MGAAPPAFGRSGRSRSQAVPGSTDKIGDEPGGQKRPARRGAARRPPDASKSSPIRPGIGFAFLLSSGIRSATQPPIEFRSRLLTWSVEIVVPGQYTKRLDRFAAEQDDGFAAHAAAPVEIHAHGRPRGLAGLDGDAGLIADEALKELRVLLPTADLAEQTVKTLGRHSRYGGDDFRRGGEN